eukprot:6186647-Pleurochrysis_carterae.AAC.2
MPGEQLLTSLERLGVTDASPEFMACVPLHSFASQAYIAVDALILSRATSVQPSNNQLCHMLER